jgi:hypothetical protein
LIPRIANIGFLCGCAGTLRAFSSPLRRLPKKKQKHGVGLKKKENNLPLD